MTKYYSFLGRRLTHFFTALCIISASSLLSSCGGGGGGSNEVRPSTLHQLRITVPGGPTLTFTADSNQATAGIETGGVSYVNAAGGPNVVVTNVTGAPNLNEIQSTWPLDIANLRYTYTPTGSSSGSIAFTGDDSETASVPVGNFNGVGSFFSRANITPTNFAIIFNSSGSAITDITVGISFDSATISATAPGANNTVTPTTPEQYATTVTLGFVRGRDGLPVPVGFEGESEALSSLLTNGSFNGGTVTLEELVIVPGGTNVTNTQVFSFLADASPTSTSSDNDSPITETGQVTVTRTLDSRSVAPTVDSFSASYIINQPFGTDEARVTLDYETNSAAIPPTDGVLVLDFSDLTSGVYTDTNGTTGTFNFLP